MVVGITRYQLNVQRDKIPIPSVTCYHGKADCFRRLKSSTDVCEVIDSVSSLKTKTSQWQYTFFSIWKGEKKKGTVPMEVNPMYAMSILGGAKVRKCIATGTLVSDN